MLGRGQVIQSHPTATTVTPGSVLSPSVEKQALVLAADVAKRSETAARSVTPRPSAYDGTTAREPSCRMGI